MTPIKIRNIIFLSFFVVLTAFGLQGFKSSAQISLPANLTSLPLPVTGWLWSSNIGWVSLSSANPTAGAGGGSYGVTADASGNLSGYGWSPNVGWLSFKASDVASCPGGTGAKINRTTNKLEGWGRFVAGGTSGAGGWDGCVEFTGTNHSVKFNPATGALTDYAWGSTVVGWLQFFASTQPVSTLPLVDLKADGKDSLLIKPGKSFTLSWNSINILPNGCAATAPVDWTTNTNAAGSEVVNIQQSTVFKIVCNGTQPNTTANDSVVVTICQPQQVIIGNACVFPIGPAVCGNGITEAGEQCDDGNTKDNDGCSATCQTEVGPPGPPTFEEF